VGDEDAATEPGRDIANDLRERWRVSNVTAADPVDLGRAEIAPRIHEGRPRLSRLSGFVAADDRDLHDTVMSPRKKSGGLKIHHSESVASR
jgi:hypothetical protein